MIAHKKHIPSRAHTAGHSAEQRPSYLLPDRHVRGTRTLVLFRTAIMRSGYASRHKLPQAWGVRAVGGVIPPVGGPLTGLRNLPRDRSKCKVSSGENDTGGSLGAWEIREIPAGDPARYRGALTRCRKILRGETRVFVTLFSLSTNLQPLGTQRPLCLRGPPQAGTYRLAPLYPRSPVAHTNDVFTQRSTLY